MAARKQPRRGARQLVDVNAYTREHPDFAMCRVWHHPWQPAKGKAIEYRNGQVVVSLECMRCEATQELTQGRRTGDVEHRRYDHAEGYIWKGVGQQKPRANELRVALVGVLAKGQR